ncbi:MAG: O-antigen polysaccharide polymerase Wzy [Burkholderiales bacterium]|nr:O-antigen polysaccharide polymerase Wzy [Burkholderiales bacterium]
MTITSMRKTFSKPDASSRWLKALTSAQAGALIFGVMMLITYLFLPLGIAFVLDVDESFITLAAVTAVAVAALALGAITPVFDPLFDGRLPRFVVNADVFNGTLWTVFVLFVFVAWGTAPQIPLIAAISGADPDTVSLLREQFLKAREGWQSSFVYINAVLSGALIPYSLALMFLNGSRWRWISAGFFLIFTMSFVEKAFFFKATIPLLYLVAQGKAKTRISPRTMLVSTFALLLLVTFFAGSGSSEESSGDPFFSVSYTPQGGLQHLIWRSVSIPLITAADAIRVLREQFGDQPLGGATSTFMASLFGLERIEFERLVFAAQWGQNETGTGSSNSVFITEAYVNYGWIGVFIFGYMIGLLMRLFAMSRDEAFRSMWPLFAIGVYTSGLIGILLSNGFLFLFIIAIFVRMRATSSSINLSSTIHSTISS